jgi:hypothetical protein
MLRSAIVDLSGSRVPRQLCLFQQRVEARISANRIEDRIHRDERQDRSWLAAEVRVDAVFQRSDSFVGASELRVDCGVGKGSITRCVVALDPFDFRERGRSCPPRVRPIESGRLLPSSFPELRESDRSSYSCAEIDMRSADG